MTLPLPQPKLAPEPGVTRAPGITDAQRAALEQRLQRARTAARPAIVPRPRPDQVPLSHAQERLWFLDQLLPDRSLYNLYQAMRVRGTLNPAALERALDEIVRRHEVFRTTFLAREDGPVQVIAPEGRITPSSADLTGVPPAEREQALLADLRAEARRPFDLTRDLLLRARLVRLGPDDHVLLLVMHHIVSDGWSLGVIFRELGILHEAFSSNKASPLPGLPIQFADYALWERESLQGDTVGKPIAFWRQQLAGAQPLELLPDHPRTAESVPRGAAQLRRLPPELVRELRALSQREGATLFMTLLSAFQVLLHRHTGQDDIVVGSCVAGRPQAELESLVGFFVNTIVLRTPAGGRPSFREFLGRTRETVLDAMAHQDLPFDVIVAELQPDRSPARNPFFQVMFVMQSAPGGAPQSAGLQLEELPLDNGTAKFDLTLSLVESAEGLAVTVEYRADLFEAETIGRFLDHYQMLLTGAVAQPGSPIGDLPLLPATERRLLETWKGDRVPYPRDASAVDLFREWARRTPHAVAISGQLAQLTYREVEEQSNRLAHHLRRRGARPGTIVAFCSERTAQVPVIMLAILKTGAAYLSLDTSYPAARLALMVEDSRPAVLVVQEHVRPLLDATLARLSRGTPVPDLVSLDQDRTAIADESVEPPDVAVPPDAVAYVCYTSGSTGLPKGACVPHRGIARLVRNNNFVNFQPDDTVLLFAPIAFDGSTIEVWGPLLNGARLAVFPPGLPSLAELASFIRSRRVTRLFLTTGLFHQIADEQVEQLGGLRSMLAGGEVLSPVHAARILTRWPKIEVINGYGPTENTTLTTTHVLTSAPPTDRPLPIGRPLNNSTVYVLDANRQPVPIGVPGELYTGGDGLALGYLRRPELTAERFLPDPFDSAPGARLYRTGDLARWRPDGTLEFLGRADRQVKLRGFRIEPAEVETVLTQHPDVGQAAVLLESGPAGPRLVGYIAGRNGTRPDPAAVRAHVAALVPDHMVPAVLVPLQEIPLNANGKVDRTALPAADLAAGPGRPPFVAPRDAIEVRLAAIWEKTLGVSPVGMHDSFFQLGGHSMSGVRLFARIEREFGRRLPLASLFQHPTVEQLAERLRAPEAVASCSSLVALQPRGTRPPIFFIHGAGGGNLWTYTNLVPHLGPDQPVYALESRGMRGLPEFERIEDMATHYLQEVRTIQPHGPYYFAGYCFGGNVAYEMARQLEAAGEEVALVGLLDSAAANSSYQTLPWWRPTFQARFLANTSYWLADFLAQPLRAQARQLLRKGRQFARRLAGLIRGRTQAVHVEEVIDVSLFPEIELGLWKIHLTALNRYHARSYRGKVVVFRTRGHPFLCSFDPQLGWAPLVGGLQVVPVPGAHEGIFMEPNVRHLGGVFRTALEQAQQSHFSTTRSTSR
jgi:amino acid adenylation domain-containing protein